MDGLTYEKRQAIIEAALMVAGVPLTINDFQQLFPEGARPGADEIKESLEAIRMRHLDTGIELKEIANGYRLQAKSELSPWLSKLWEGRMPRYSRAFLETLAIIAYRQPITRAEIEAIRGVTVSSHIIKMLFDQDWIRIVGYRDVPGKPALLGTTKNFLDYFNLQSLTELPNLATFQNLDDQAAKLQVQLSFENSKDA